MTEDDLRRIIREELAAAGLTNSPSDPAPLERREADTVLEWIGSLAPGTSGVAGELLLLFKAGSPPPRTCGRVGWTAISFGMALARARGRIVNDRFLERDRMRNGCSVFTVTAFPR